MIKQRSDRSLGHLRYTVLSIDQFSQDILAMEIDTLGNSFVQVATIYGITGLTNETALETSGVLITH